MVATHRVSFSLLFAAAALLRGYAHAQLRSEPGRSIGKVSTQDQLIVLELDEGVLGKANLFDLTGRTLRFMPEHHKSGAAGAGYRVENSPLQWNEELGPEIQGSDVRLQNLQFPFSGKVWVTFSVGTNGSIRFGGAAMDAGAGLGEGDRIRGDFAGRVGGVQTGRFDQLADAAANLINTVPAICVFMKPRMFGARYAKELGDRVVVTWDVTEPWGNIQDFTWTKTINRFQAVLHKDGTIEMSYQQLAARDAIVGVYPMVANQEEKSLATMRAKKNPALAAHLDIRRLNLALLGGLLLKVTIETRGPAVPEGDARLAGVVYRVYFNAHKAPPPGAASTPPDATWTIRGFAPANRAEGGGARYFAAGPGISRGVKVSGDTISIQGILPPTLRGMREVTVSADAAEPGSRNPVAQVARHAISLAAIRSPEVHFSALKPQDGPFPIVYEAFHYLALPNSRDLACTVIRALGDKFDFLAYYSDFRLDNQEAGTPSNGPLGGGPAGGAVTGIGATQRGLDSYCTAGRFQWQFNQPVYVGSNQMQERPPGSTAVGSPRDITYYAGQLAEASPDHNMRGYNYAMSQLAHEMGHRWAAFVSAKVGDETIALGPTHWARGLQAPAAFPYQRPYEASMMGGGVWQDNFDGTFTQLDDDYYVPATGWSHLDLYLMGLISAAEVPDFFILRNLTPAGRDGNGHPIFKANHTKIRIQDVIAVEGLRQPDPEHSQRAFNTGIALLVEHGATPSPELIERANAIRQIWMDYWATTTGQRATMSTQP